MTQSSETMLDIREKEENKHLEMLELEMGMNCKSHLFPDTCTMLAKLRKDHSHRSTENNRRTLGSLEVINQTRHD